MRLRGERRVCVVAREMVCASMRVCVWYTLTSSSEIALTLDMIFKTYSREGFLYPGSSMALRPPPPVHIPGVRGGEVERGLGVRG